MISKKTRIASPTTIIGEKFHALFRCVGVLGFGFVGNCFFVAISLLRNKRQSNLPEPEAEKDGSTAAKAADTKDNSWEKMTTAGRPRDRPPARSVMRRNNGNVENKLREIEEDASGVVRTKRFGDNFGRAEHHPAGRGRGSGPRQQQLLLQRGTSRQDRQQRSDGREFVRRQQQSDKYHYYPPERVNVDETLATLKNNDKPEVAGGGERQLVRNNRRKKNFV